MPVQDISSTEYRSMTRDVSDDEFPDEDAESDYQSCGSFISDADMQRTAENYVEGELDLSHLILVPYNDPIQASELIGASMTATEWISALGWHPCLQDLVWPPTPNSGWIS
ncbi:hypothetical protein BDZ89DRAFT_1152407 [Hymenopellis radicata]|nr:hypothetical protein BDZ89DRAFT_1152407 [Hymenopellis radicata]